jgi:hypothetical protein
MGVIANVNAQSFPRQGCLLGKDIRICFNYNTSLMLDALCVRDDEEEPFRTIFQLPDGRFILGTECQYSEP